MNSIATGWLFDVNEDALSSDVSAAARVNPPPTRSLDDLLGGLRQEGGQDHLCLSRADETAKSREPRVFQLDDGKFEPLRRQAHDESPGAGFETQWSSEDRKLQPRVDKHVDIINLS
jgi:hypothetical protein